MSNANVNLGILIGATDRGASSVIDRITGSVNRLDRAAGGAGSGGLARFASVLKMGVVAGATAALGAIAALGAGIVKTTLEAADMEQGIANIASVMGLAKDETSGLKSLIMGLGIDPKLKVSATEAAGAVEMLARNGLSLDDIMGGAARNTILLANATGADFKVAADIATDAMAIFGIEAKDMQSAVNGIVGVTNTSKFGIEDYALALGTGAKGAAAAEISFDQFNQMLIATSSNFTSGMTAGTSLTAMMLGLAPRTDKAAGLMKELGIITEEGQNRFFDLNGQMRDNATIAEVMRDTLGKLAPEQRLTAVNTIFGRDAMAAINGMISTTTESWDRYANALATTDAEQSAATRMDTLRGSLEILKGLFETLRIQIGDKFVPVFRLLSDKAGAFLAENGPMMVEWAGRLANQLEVLVTQWLPGVVRQLQEWWSSTTGLIEFTRQFGIMAGVWRILEPAIDAALAKLSQWTSALIEYIVDSLPAWTAKLSEWGAAAWTWIADASVLALAALGDWLVDMGLWIVRSGPTLYAHFLKWSTSMWQWIADALPASIDAFGDWLTGILSWNDTEGQTGIESAASGWASALWVWIRDDVIPVIGPELLKLSLVMAEALGKIAVALATAAAKIGLAIITSIAQALLDLVGIDVNLDQIRRTIFDTLDGWKNQIFEQGASVIERIGAGMRDALSNPLTAIGNITTAIANAFTTWLGNNATGALAEFLEGGGDLIRNIRDGINKFINDPPAALSSILTATRTTFLAWLEGGSGILATILDGGKRIVSSLRDGITFLAADNDGHPAKNLGDLLINLDASFTRWLNSSGAGATLFRNGGKALIEAIRNGITLLADNDANSPIQAISDTLGRIITAFNGWVNSNTQRLMDGGKSLMQSVASGISSIISDWSSGSPLNTPLEWLINNLGAWANLNYNMVKQNAFFFGNAIVTAIGQAIRDGSNTLSQALSYLVNLLPQWVKDILGIGGASASSVLGASLSQLGEIAGSSISAAAGTLSGTHSALSNYSNNVSNSQAIYNQFTVAQGPRVDRDALEQVRQLNMLYGVA